MAADTATTGRTPGTGSAHGQEVSPFGLGWVAAALAVAGAALRLGHFVARRPLWLDECMLALNVATRSAVGLVRPLDYDQVAPLLFLWIERLAVRLGGVNELALRAWPTLAGIALVVLMWPVARRLAGPGAALAAVAMAAFSPTLLRYADEAKPYGPDALVTAALVLAALAVAEAGTRRRWLLLAVTGVVALVASIPAAFVLAGIAGALALHPPARHTHTRALVACAAAFVLLYLLYYRPGATNPHQHEGYGMAFLTPGPGLGGRAGLALRGTLLPTFVGNGWVPPDVTARSLTALGLPLVLGLIVVGRRHGTWAAVLLAGPLVAVTAASVLRRYPLGVPRLMVFASPLLVWMAAAAVAGAADLLRARWRTAAGAVMVALVCAPMAKAALANLRDPWRGEDAPALVAAFRGRPRTGEPVYVGARGIPSWVFYTTNWTAPSAERLAFYARAGSDGPSFENGPPRLRYVHDEGADLVFPFHDRREILGLYSGRQWRWPDYRGTPDPGWAENEAARIVREANPCAWLYFTHVSENTHRPITWQLRDTYHGERVFQLVVPGGVLYRYCFPSAAGPAAPAPGPPAGL